MADVIGGWSAVRVSRTVLCYGSQAGFCAKWLQPGPFILPTLGCDPGVVPAFDPVVHIRSNARVPVTLTPSAISAVEFDSSRTPYPRFQPAMRP